MACQAPSGNDDNGDKKPPRETKKNGYECELVEPPPKHLQSECPICLQILREPRLVDCCGHNYCETCIERVGKAGKPCPLCNEPGFTTMANKGLKRTLHEFRVYCPHRLRGCKWEGELGKLDEHLNSNPHPQRRLEGCPLAVIECLHCKEGILRDKIAGHQLKRCPQRPYMCEYCAEYKSTFEDVAHNHWPECECFLLLCPNECTPSVSGIQRQHLAKHVKEDCPLTVVQCELHHAGCEVTLPRKDMADHMKEDSIAHISLLVQELIQTKQELTHTKQELTRTKQELTQKVATQSQELTRIKQELTQKKLEFLSPCPPQPFSLPSQPSLVDQLSRLLSASDNTNDDIFVWIEKSCEAAELKTVQFVQSLTASLVQASVRGSGTSALFGEELFNLRVLVLLRYVQSSAPPIAAAVSTSEDELQVEVLCALQVAMAKLNHPPNLLHQMFNMVYDVEVVGEKAFFKWREEDRERMGKGHAVDSVKPFFDWLESAEVESDGSGDV